MKTGVIEWASISRPMPGEVECGDRCFVTETGQGVLVAVIDGLGHGHEAAIAAERAVRTIECNKEATPWEIAHACNEALKDTRGVVLSLALLANDGTMTWIGIGNVEGRLVRWHQGAGASLLLRTGLIGAGEMPTVWPLTLPVRKNDILTLVTDGIQRDFEVEINLKLDPEHIATNIMRRNSKANDDALVFVARFEG